MATECFVLKITCSSQRPALAWQKIHPFFCFSALTYFILQGAQSLSILYPDYAAGDLIGYLDDPVRIIFGCNCIRSAPGVKEKQAVNTLIKWLM